jgi:hypothetical protein
MFLEFRNLDETMKKTWFGPWATFPVKHNMVSIVVKMIELVHNNVPQQINHG